MPSLSKSNFEKFFFFGIENKKDVEEAIIYYSCKEMYTHFKNKTIYSVPAEEKLAVLTEYACKHYRQFYRFVNLNDDEKTSMYHTENQEKIILDRVKENIQTYLKEGKMYSSEAGIFFYRNEEYACLQRGWTYQIYQNLRGLEKLEQTDLEKYCGTWLAVKLERAKNRQNKEEIDRATFAIDMFQKRKQKLHSPLQSDDIEL